jgi:hypothetical protein
MSTAEKRRLTAAEYLAIEAADPAATIGLGSLDVSVPPTEIDDGVEFPGPSSPRG